MVREREEMNEQTRRTWRIRPGARVPCSQRGFTLIELMIVISIILILVGIAAGMYQQSIRRARESVLKQDLQTMRTAIDNYTMDKLQAPQSLQDLADAHYLRDLPIDPFTQQRDWVAHFGDTIISPEQTGTGVDDVHSNSDQTGSDGTAYNTW
ncbi:MAG TPA: prepilin-type N-terminal cleavage/methylation domain-containing protein [Verrucomicrobiae bacterium]|nr:prepilin-type N-terminal cleavage/methylation domain-containing protein [Verrucomicrobiae bacterium]